MSESFGKFRAFKRVAACAMLAAGWSIAAPAQAATTTFTVTTLLPGESDTSVGDGICLTAAGECSLYAALQEANALGVTLLDDVRIVFEASLNGDIQPTQASQLMFTGALGVTIINDYLGQGAFYYVNALRPVTIDFGNRVGVVQQNDAGYAAFFINSNDVVIENFLNDAKRDVDGTGGYADAAGIVGAEAAFVVAGSRVTIRNGLSSDPGTIAMETCVALTDGARDVLIEDYYCRSSFRFGFYVDERTDVYNVTLNRVQTQGIEDYGDIWVEFGAADDKTGVHGLTITDSEFRSRRGQGIDYTIGIRENSVVDNLTISNSRFLGPDTWGIGLYPTAITNNLTVENSTIDGTAYFVVDRSGALQSGFTIRDNLFNDVFGDILQLTDSPYSNAVIENNRFLKGRQSGNLAGVRLGAANFGLDNVVRNNVFDQQDSSETNRFAIWVESNPGVGLSTGWSIENNQIANIFGSAFGPISLFNNGNTRVSGNTFGEGTRGTTDPAQSEAANAWFVNNTNGGTNGRIQTWRPTNAVSNGSAITVTVGPVNPPLGGLSPPTGPVAIDVYLTATDKAEVYLGRIPGVHLTETTFTFTSNAQNGFVRAQITDAAGRSSQYSGAQELAEGLDGTGDNDQDGLPDGAECPVNLLNLALTLLCPDSDLDGLPDFQDPDDDNDGIPTLTECPDGSPCVNTDGDLFLNHLDTDSDGDGISDAEECSTGLPCRDTDGDGKANYVDTDADGDGFSDREECPISLACRDTDNDGTPDYLQPAAALSVRGTGAGAFGPGALVLLGAAALWRRRRMVALPLAASLGLGGTAQAADEASWTSRFYGGAMVGALFTDFDDGDLTQALQSDGHAVSQTSTDSDKLGYGAWLGYTLTSRLGLELSYTTGADERVRFTGTVADLDDALDTASDYLSGYGDSYLLRLRYYQRLTDRWFLSPRVGVGMTQTRQTFISGDEKKRYSDDSFTWAVGGALQYALTEDWSVGVSADYYQGSSDNAYSLVSGVVEWRFPKALRVEHYPLPPAEQPPVEVVPVMEMAAASTSETPVPAAAAPAAAAAESLDLKGVSFEVNSAKLTPTSQEILDTVALQLQSRLQDAPQLSVEVSGHTDNTGNDARNQRLSQARAQAVRDYLASRGVDGSRLSAVGYGASQPLAPNDTAEGRAQNRRVELKLTGA